MTQVVHMINYIGHFVQFNMAHFACRHPLVAGICTAIVMPVVLVLAVALFTAAVVFPVAWICGWL